MKKASGLSQPWLIAILGSLAGGTAAVLLGFSPDWDLLNYHLYNPHALLHGRLHLDIAPAQTQGFLNPLYHIPFYLLFMNLGPIAMVFVTGALQGLHWVLLGLLLMQILPTLQSPKWTVWAAAAFGLSGPIFIYELGGTQGDTVISMLILAALYLCLPANPGASQPHAKNRLWLAGLLAGLAAALKLTMALYVVGLLAAIMMCRPFQDSGKSAFQFATACLLGFLMGGIAWFGWLWISFQNPLFPFFNQFFDSQWASAVSYRDHRFLPQGTLEWLFYPLTWWREDFRVWELQFRDVRPLLLYPLMFLVPLIGWKKIGRNAPGVRMLLVFIAASFLVWLPLFSIYRYLSVIEMLAPLALFAIFTLLGRSRRVAYGGLTLLVITQMTVAYQRPPPLPTLDIDQASSLQELPPDSMVVVSGYEPVAFIALWLNDEIPIIRVRSNFIRPDVGLLRRQYGGHLLSKEALDRIRKHRGPLYLLRSPGTDDTVQVRDDLQRFGLEWDINTVCRPVFVDPEIHSRIALELCPL